MKGASVAGNLRSLINVTPDGRRSEDSASGIWYAWLVQHRAIFVKLAPDQEIGESVCLNLPTNEKFQELR